MNEIIKPNEFIKEYIIKKSVTLLKYEKNYQKLKNNKNKELKCSIRLKELYRKQKESDREIDFLRMKKKIERKLYSIEQIGKGVVEKLLFSPLKDVVIRFKKIIEKSDKKGDRDNTNWSSYESDDLRYRDNKYIIDPYRTEGIYDNMEEISDPYKTLD